MREVSILKIRILLIYLVIILINSTVYSQYLRVPETIQEQDQWCWAATSSCVLNYYGKNIPQCMCAEYTREVAVWHNFGSIDCCVDPNQGCNYWNYNWGYAGSIEDILSHWGVASSGVSSSLSYSSCQTEINAGHPFILRWGWTTGGGHFLVGHGVIVLSHMLYYMDPWFGEGLHIADYSWVVQGGNHTWTHTNRMNTNPLLPSVPVLSLPLNHSINQSTALNLIWKKCDRVSNYKVQVSLDSVFNNIIINDSTLTDTLKYISGLTTLTTYFWRVRAKNSSGSSYYSNVWDFKTSVTGIEPISSEIPLKYALYQNYPNPFNPVTKIKFDIASLINQDLFRRVVVLKIYDLLGREIATLVNEQLRPGTYEVEWNGSDYPSGVYFYRITAGNFTNAEKMIMIK
jgi:hypothetical protein